MANLDYGVTPLTYDELVALRKEHGHINVMWLGALGDSSDDTTAIQNAVNWNSITIATTATTAAGNNTLTFGANLTSAFRERINAGVSVNVWNLTNPTSLKQDFVDGGVQAIVDTSSTSTTVTLLAPGGISSVLSQIQIGDQIRFDFADRGTIFFPRTRLPNDSYVITSSILLDYQGVMSFTIEGEGGAAQITSNQADYVFKRRTSNPGGGIKIFRNLDITNSHASGGGIKMQACSGTSISDSWIRAYRCITFGNDATASKVDTVVMSGSMSSGSWGVYGNNALTLVNCDFRATDNAVRFASTGLTVVGGRCEVCNVGYMIGMDEDGDSVTAHAIDIFGVSMESNVTGIKINGGSEIKISSTSISANDNPETDPERGIWFTSGAYITVSATTASGYFSIAGIDAEDVLGKATFISCQAATTFGGASDDWIWPSNLVLVEAINCSGVPTGLIGNLSTADPFFAGRFFVVTDANTTLPSRRYNSGSYSFTAATGGSSNIVTVTPMNDAGTWRWGIL
jgi:hypothetical protein